MARTKDPDRVTEDDVAYVLKLRLRTMQENLRSAVENDEGARAERLTASIARLREELDAKMNGRSATKMATATKKGTKKDERVEQDEQGPSKEEREAARQARVEEAVEAIAARIMEGIELELDGEKFRAAFRESLDDIKPTAEIAARMKESHGLQYGRHEGKGIWRVPVSK